MKTLLAFAVLLQLVWGLVPTASQFVIQEIQVELYIAIRWTISGGIFLLYLLFTKKWKPIAFSDLTRVALLGLGGFGLASFGTLYGLKLGGVTNFALMGALNPAVTSVVAILVLKERPKALFYLALPLCVAGLVFLIFGKYQLSSMSIALASAALILGAAFLEGFIFTFSQRFKSKMGTVEYLAIAQLSAAAFLWLLQASVFHQWAELNHLSMRGFCAAAFVSIVACVLCYAVLYWLLNFIDGHRLALFDGVHTLSATFFGLILFHEHLNGWMIFGGLCLISGLILGNWSSRAESKPKLSRGDSVEPEPPLA